MAPGVLNWSWDWRADYASKLAQKEADELARPTLPQLTEEQPRVAAPTSLPAPTPPRVPTNRATPKDRMLGTSDRLTRMNTSAILGNCPMSSVVYGFRPESGWAGVLFQIFLQGEFIESWKTKVNMEYWVCFHGQDVKAALIQQSTAVSVPDIGSTRYILQCIVPDIPQADGRIPVTLRVEGDGGKVVNPGLCVGMFTYKPDDGTLISYEYNWNFIGLMDWLQQKIPQDTEHPSPVNGGEILDPNSSQLGQRVIVANPATLQVLQDASLEPQLDSESNLEWLPFVLPMNNQRFDFTPFLESDLEQPENCFFDMPQATLGGEGELNNDFLYTEEFQEVSAFPLTGNPDSDFNLLQMSLEGTEHLTINPWEPLDGNHDQEYNPYVEGEALLLGINPLLRRSVADQMSEQGWLPQVPTNPTAKGIGRLVFRVKPEPLGDFPTWSPQERQNNRRIVAFTKQSFGDGINIDCQPITSDNYNEDMLTISCIRWAPSPPGSIQHKFAGKCIFTSVDIIALLEKMVSHKFSVQEKNRIRRNLEGFRPQTVKKSGSTSQVFTQVMSYTAPLARSIEKDIKVFLWHDITKALKKVVQKYHVGGGVEIGEPLDD